MTQRLWTKLYLLGFHKPFVHNIGWSINPSPLTSRMIRQANPVGFQFRDTIYDKILYEATQTYQIIFLVMCKSVCVFINHLPTHWHPGQGWAAGHHVYHRKPLISASPALYWRIDSSWKDKVAIQLYSLKQVSLREWSIGNILLNILHVTFFNEFQIQGNNGIAYAESNLLFCSPDQPSGYQTSPLFYHLFI